MTLAKRTLLVVFIAFFILVIWVASRPLSTPRTFLNHRRAVHSIQDLTLAERNYAARHPTNGYACSLNDLGEQGFVDAVLASGTKAGYRFEIRCFQDGAQKVSAYEIIALPLVEGTTGKYALCSDQRGEIWYSENGLASDCLATHKPVEQEYR